MEAINTAFPKTEVQRCIIHQIGNSTKYVSYKDLKPIYRAASEESTLEFLSSTGPMS